MIRKAVTILFIATLAVLLGGCVDTGGSDDERAAKYKAAAESIDRVDRAEVDYKTVTGMGRTGGVTIYADSSDPAIMTSILEEAFPAIVDAADGDPEVSLPIQVVSSDGKTALGMSTLGFSGGQSLNNYREFLSKK